MLDDARIEGSIGRILGETLIVIARNLRQPRIATGPPVLAGWKYRWLR